MKVMAFNGSPRKTWNTAMLLEKALEGAAKAGAQTELVHLNDLTFKGCQSCFSCKIRGGKSYGKCDRKDDLTPILERVREADAIIMSSPVYLGTETAAARALLERVVYPYLVYDGSISCFPRKIKTGYIYTMNITEADVNNGRQGLDQHIKYTEDLMKRIFGASESLVVTDTYQFKDYSKFVVEIFDAQSKWKRRQEVFPQDLQKAFDMGVRFAQGAN
ncbi:flavodoxin family protein [Chloroflexota bacterium]